MAENEEGEKLRNLIFRGTLILVTLTIAGGAASGHPLEAIGLVACVGLGIRGAAFVMSR